VVNPEVDQVVVIEEIAMTEEAEVDEMTQTESVSNDLIG